MVKHTLKILQQMLQDFKSVFDHFGTLCIKGLKILYVSDFQFLGGKHVGHTSGSEWVVFTRFDEMFITNVKLNAF